MWPKTKVKTKTKEVDLAGYLGYKITSLRIDSIGHTEFVRLSVPDDKFH